MNNRKPIKLHKGDVKKLALMCGTSTRTVYSALHWNADTKKENEVRETCLKYFDYKKF
jgi:uridine phosphorylase